MKNICRGVLLNSFFIKLYKKSHLCLHYTFLILVNSARESDKSYTINQVVYFGLYGHLQYKETLINVIDDLTRHSYIAKLKITSSWYRTKSKATTGVKNTASYIPWLYTTWDQMVASNMIHCVLVLMTTTITQAFCIKFKQCLFIILKLITHI